MLAFGMMLTDPLTITNVSPAPDVEKFLFFLEEKGARIDHSSDLIKLRGRRWNGTLIVDERVPDQILHAVVGSAVFSCHSVKIVDNTGKRAWIIKSLFNVLRNIGLSDDAITIKGKTTIVTGAEYNPPDIVTVGSSWEFETVVSASFSVLKPVVVSYPSSLVTHIVKMAELLGFTISHTDGGKNLAAELSRRLARSVGNKPQEIRRFEWIGGNEETIAIPGDTMIAAAVGGTAALFQRSDVVMKGVLWEQGRRGFFDALRRMKIQCEWEPCKDSYDFDSADVRIRWSKSEGIHLSADQALSMRSELLILGIVAVFAQGNTVIVDSGANPAFDRELFKVVAHGLEKFGAHVGFFSDGLALEGVHELKGAVVESEGHPDAALALAVAGAAASGTTVVEGFGRDDYPVREFFSLIGNLVQSGIQA
jgi:5-enolpyruvylshikimate-3-phosphate synthase